MRTHRKAVQGRFVDAVRSGLKRTTIRPIPKHASDRPEEGDALVLYRWTGRPYRSPQEVIGRYSVLQDAVNIEVHEQCIVEDRDGDTPLVWAPNFETGDANLFARWEGFTSWSEMIEWFRDQHGLPFRGILIQWRPSP